MSESTRSWGLPPGAAAWTALDGIDPGRSSLAVAIGPDGKVYAIGGSVGPETEMSAFNAVVESFTGPPAAPETTAWDQTPADLPFGIYGHSAATVGDYLYVVGGTAFSGDLATTLRWRPGDAEWEQRAGLPTARTRFGAAGGVDGRLYAVGGDETLGEVVAYSPEADVWFPVAPLSTGRRNHAVTPGPDGRIWAIGGNDIANVLLGTAEAYGPRLAINPAQGPPGTLVQIAGTNFAADATVSIRIGSAAGEEQGTATTNPTGAMTTPVVYMVPSDAAAGTRISIFAIDDRSEFPVHLEFRVN